MRSIAKKVVVGMSGGVDSAIAAYLLKKQGYEVIGVTLRSWENEGNRCCEIDEARRIAFKLSFPFYPWNVVPLFREKVIEPFISDYIHGRTPNPCVLCNRYVKWDKLLYIANVTGADFVATGHYAAIRKMGERFSVGIAKDKSKDQSYMLYQLTQEELSRTIFPLSELTKPEVRNIAREIGLSVAEKSDSQEICFVADGNYADFLERESSGVVPGEGNFLDVAGNIIGRHKGIINYTVGQRKGLGLACGVPVYVKKICPEKNEIIVGREDELYSGEMTVTDVNYMGIAPLKKDDTIRAKVKVRYHHNGEMARISCLGDSLKIVFDNSVRAVTPGQSAVFYSEDGTILGGGTIGPLF